MLQGWLCRQSPHSALQMTSEFGLDLHVRFGLKSQAAPTTLHSP